MHVNYGRGAALRWGVGLWFIGDVIFALNESLWRHDDTVAASDVIALSCAG